MAFINGNKQIVTNGLVYGVDFINSKTYLTGSSFKSLVYPNITGSLINGAAVNSGSLLFTSSTANTSNLLEVFPFINVSGSFTVSWIGRSNSTTEKFFLNQETNSSESLYTTIGTGSNTLALVNKQQGGFTGRVYRYTPSTKAYYTWVYDSGNYLYYINGLPITASSNVIASSSLDKGTGRNFSFNGTYLNLSGSEFNIDTSFSGSLDMLLIYNRALSYNEVYQNYTNNSYKIGPNITPKLTVDPHTYLYTNAINLTDSASISVIDTFITNLKSNNLWNKIAVAYPMLGSTSASHAINLKDPNAFNLKFNDSWSFNNSGSSPSSSNAFISSSYYTVSSNNNNYPGLTIDNSHFTYLSYNLPTTSSNLFGVVQAASVVGGQVYYSGSKAYHVFTASGDLHVGVPFTASVLAIGGGGAGHAVFTGGGGAGGLVTGSIIVQPGSYPVNVGAGGANGANRYVRVFNGQDTTVFNFTAFGGGRAGSNYATVAGYIAGNSGGSGGGGNPAGLGITGQGNNGAGSSGGGGGAGTAAIGIDGGSGSYIAEYATVGPGFGSPAGWFAGGGGAGRGFTYGGWGYGGLGGIGGGGNGGDQPGASIRTGSSGVPNTGGGGGGGGFPDDSPGGRGGSGLVIVSYETSSLLALTSSFTVYLTDTSLSGSHNSSTSLAVTASGNIGLVSISRTGSATMQIYRNLVSASVTATASTTPVGPLYINAVNLNNTASGISPYTVSYLSYGLGMSTTEMLTYQNLISQLQTNLKRQNTLLDNYSGAAAAYSLRRIGPSSYFGPAIRVRRDSDNALRDIGFTSDGQLDTVGLLDFVGVTGSGFVQTWYDQSGRGVNLQQTSNGAQPYILLSGSFKNQGPKPTIEFRNSADLQLVSDISSVNSDYSWLYVRSMGPYINAYYFGFDDSPALLIDRPVAAYYQTSFQGTGITGNRALLQQYLISTGASVYQNNTLLNSGLPYVQAKTRAGLSNSGMYQLYGYAEGNTQELIVYTGSRLSDQAVMASNMNNYWKIYGDATASFDPDYSAFITATGITQPTQSAALETLVSDLKSYGLWNKMKAIYPMITDKYNLYSNTENFSAGWLTTNSTVTASNVAGPYTSSLVANRLNDSISTPVTFTVTNNGASAYTIDGSDNPLLTLERGRTYNFSISATGHPFYIMTGSGAYSAGGQYNTGVTGQGTENGTLTFTVPNDAPSTLAYVCQFHASMAGTISVVENTDQHYIYQTVALQSGSVYVMSTHARWNGRDYIVLNPDGNSKTWFDIRNGFVSSSQGTVATASITRVSGSASNPSGSWYRCAMVFTSSVSAPSNTSIQLATADGDLTYGSLTGLSGSFLWGAQLEPGDFISPYLSNNTGNAFTTGSILDQMKYNLKNPAQFTGSYFGTWTPGYSGNKPDGVSAYMNTGLNASTEITFNSIHLSYYSRTNTLTGDKVEVGSIANTTTYLPLVQLSIKRTESSISNRFVSLAYSYFPPDALDIQNLDSTGYYLLSRTTSNSFKHFKNSTQQGSTVTTNSQTTVPNRTLFIGAANTAGNAAAFSDRQCAIATIGDGLTDYEAKALYWIVQKYQTSLGRQVY